MKKLLCGLLCLVLALSALASVAMAETATGDVRILTNVTGGKDEEEMVLWAQALSEATGLNVTLEKPASDYNNVLMQKLSANESYDLIYVTANQYLNLVEQGALTEEEAQNHPRKNLITRALGVGRDVEADFGEKEVSPRDILLLCSDGLSNCVSVPQIEETLARTPFYEAADALVQKALEGGGLDNITVLLMQVEAVEENNG